MDPERLRLTTSSSSRHGIASKAGVCWLAWGQLGVGEAWYEDSSHPHHRQLPGYDDAPDEEFEGREMDCRLNMIREFQLLSRYRRHLAERN